MIVEKRNVSVQDIKDFIQAGPLVTEVQTFSDGSIDRIRMLSREDDAVIANVIIISVVSVSELVAVVEEAE